VLTPQPRKPHTCNNIIINVIAKRIEGERENKIDDSKPDQATESFSRFLVSIQKIIH
jgi:hypothetical protein